MLRMRPDSVLKAWRPRLRPEIEAVTFKAGNTLSSPYTHFAGGFAFRLFDPDFN